jgi:putative oxidoreductase
MSQSAPTVSRVFAAEANSLEAYAPVVPLIGRLLLAPLFILSGLSKLAAPSAIIAMIGASGLPFPTLGLALAVAVEIVGGIALVVGYRTRLATIALALFTIATAVAFHNDLGDQNQFFHFFKNISIAGGLLQVVALGAGRFSIDALRRG